MLIGKTPSATWRPSNATPDASRRAPAASGKELANATQEILCVAIGVELDQVVAEQPAQERLGHAGRQQPEDVRRRKRDVPEMVNEDVRRSAAELRRNEREVIVLHPDLRRVRSRVATPRTRRARSAR